jgi:hypothetical protein
MGAEASRVKVHVWKDGAEVYVTLPNVTEWPIEVTPGETNSWQLQSDLDGRLSALSAAFSYSEPFQTLVPPTILVIR